MIETKPDFQRSWYDYSWDWVLISLFALLVFAGLALWTYKDYPRTAAIPDDATTGQSTRPDLSNFPN
jgi:hypothetical protein